MSYLRRWALPQKVRQSTEQGKSKRNTRSGEKTTSLIIDEWNITKNAVFKEAISKKKFLHTEQKIQFQAQKQLHKRIYFLTQSFIKLTKTLSEHLHLYEIGSTCGQVIGDQG